MNPITESVENDALLDSSTKGDRTCAGNSSALFADLAFAATLVLVVVGPSTAADGLGNLFQQCAFVLRIPWLVAFVVCDAGWLISETTSTKFEYSRVAVSRWFSSSPYARWFFGPKAAFFLTKFLIMLLAGTLSLKML